jgi:periplasmic divalent cation tolerance protein
MIDAIVVLTTTDSREEADRIATSLIERSLAACVQIIGPISSVYRWEGSVTQSAEWLCLVKSTRNLYPQLEAAICELHSYEVPEILALPVVECHTAYLTWLMGSFKT